MSFKRFCKNIIFCSFVLILICTLSIHFGIKTVIYNSQPYASAHTSTTSFSDYIEKQTENPPNMFQLAMERERIESMKRIGWISACTIYGIAVILFLVGILKERKMLFPSFVVLMISVLVYISSTCISGIQEKGLEENTSKGYQYVENIQSRGFE